MAKKLHKRIEKALVETRDFDSFVHGLLAGALDWPIGQHVREIPGIGWEWTGSELDLTDAQARTVLGEMPLKSIRGGAFDTYFDTQATSNFRTGQIVLGRTHNLGFRCALDV